MRKKPLEFMKVIFLGFFVFLFDIPSYSQHLFKGRIVSESDGSPIPFASVFLANTTFGIVSDEKGLFELEIPDGSYEVVVRFVGFETIQFTLNTAAMQAKGYQIRMKVEEQELTTLEVEDKRDPSWYKNLTIFKRNFIGSSNNSLKTKILNEKSLLMDSYSSPGELIVSARDIIQIENVNLGYRIEYFLGQFNFSSKEGKVLYSGNQLFISDSTMGRTKARRIEKNRAEAYYGSIQHFIQSLYFGLATEEGFLIKEITRVPNPKRPSDQLIALAKTLYMTSEDKSERDSLEFYYLEKERLPRIVRVLNDTLLEPERFVRMDVSGKKYFVIPDLIEVTYTKENEEFNYVGRANLSKIGLQKSIIDQVNLNLEIYPNGNYSDTFGIILEGYMAWEKVGDLVPLDYLPKGVPWKNP